MSKEITKHLYERAAAWMADFEDSSLLEENMPKEDVEQFLLDEAFDIMYQLYLIYQEEEDQSDE